MEDPKIKNKIKILEKEIQKMKLEIQLLKSVSSACSHLRKSRNER